jgi:predicted GIY-YIG superfamily endonuclease
MTYFVYVRLNPKGKTYVGQTADLERRLNQHNDPACRLTLHTKRQPRSLATASLCGVFVPISRDAPGKRT